MEKKYFYLLDSETNRTIPIEGVREKGQAQWEALCPKCGGSNQTININEKLNIVRCHKCGWTRDLNHLGLAKKSERVESRKNTPSINIESKNIYKTHGPGYRKMGLIPLPAPPTGKNPELEIKWSELKTNPPVSDDYAMWEDKFPSDNIWGLIGGLLVLDPDGSGAEEFVKSLNLPRCPTVRSGGKSIHRYFRTSKSRRAFKVKMTDGTFLEVRTGNQGILLPPSIHPETKRKYEWVGRLNPWEMDFPELPDEIYDKLFGMYLQSKRPRKELTHRSDNNLRGLRVEEYLAHYRIELHDIKQWQNATLYRLNRCLFHADHEAPDTPGDACIIRWDDGALNYQCFHNHCSDKKWEDARKVISGDKIIREFCEGHVDPKPLDNSETDSKGKTEGKKLAYEDLNLPSSLEISRLEINVEWVVKNLIPKESITLLHSIGGVGKSYLMYGIAKAVAEGEPFFGLDVMRIPVYYIDFENPLPEISDRMKKIGGSEDLKIWHLGHEPMPVRFDAEGWEIYKAFPPGLFIIDSLRSSHLLEENSSKDASLIMGRHKQIRALGNTIFLIHHENKVGGYRGSTAWFDLSDHILKFSRVKSIGSDEDVEEDDFTLPIRLGLGGKSRFSSAMEFTSIHFKFENHQLCLAKDPDEELLRKMADLLDPMNPPNQSEFQKLVKKNGSSPN